MTNLFSILDGINDSERDGVIVESCCGFESDDCEYINTVIEEFIEIDRASRAKEDEESKYWEDRGVLTC